MDVFATAGTTPGQPLVGLPPACADVAAFSPDEKLMATSTPALYRTGDRPDDWQLTAPHPAFSPEGHWVVAGGTLLHLPTGTVRSFDPSESTTVAIFAPNGDILAGSSDQSITRYCRTP